MPNPFDKLASCRTRAGKVGGQEALAEKCGVDAVTVVAFAYDTYTNPFKKQRGAPRNAYAEPDAPEPANVALLRQV
jgi:hypothetical protein